MKLIFNLATFLISLFTIFGEQGLLYLGDILNQLQQLKTKKSALESELLVVKEKSRDILNNRATLEKVAREDLGFSQKGDTVYAFYDYLVNEKSKFNNP
jgi:cell division protein FtsB